MESQAGNVNGMTEVGEIVFKTARKTTDFLVAELSERLTRRPAEFRLLVQLGGGPGH
jgi:hypothetical protein